MLLVFGFFILISEARLCLLSLVKPLRLLDVFRLLTVCAKYRHLQETLYVFKTGSALNCAISNQLSVFFRV
jgi:hypothetical protein